MSDELFYETTTFEKESKWDSEGSEYFLRIGLFILFSFILQAFSSFFIVKTIKNFEKPTERKRIETIKSNSNTHFTTRNESAPLDIERISYTVSSGESFQGLNYPIRRRYPRKMNKANRYPKDRQLNPILKNGPIAQPKPRKDPEDDVKFIEKGPILITSHNITELAIMDGDFKPEKKKTIKKVLIDPKRFTSYDIGENVDQFEEVNDKAGSVGSASAVTASIKLPSMRKF